MGAAFATTPWNQLSINLDAWIELVRERSELLAKLAGYDEEKLLALDLTVLQTSLQTAIQSWWLVKWLKIGGIRRQLRATRVDLSKPEVATLGDVLKHALRLHLINAKLNEADSAARACLGILWTKGEPAADELSRARVWGEKLHANMLACAGDDLGWLGQLRQLLSALFTEGPAVYAVGTTIGGRFICYRDSLTQLRTAVDVVYLYQSISFCTCMQIQSFEILCSIRLSVGDEHNI